MLQHVELDPQTSLFSQFADTLDEPIFLVNLFNVDHKDHEKFKSSWGTDASFFTKQQAAFLLNYTKAFKAVPCFSIMRYLKIRQRLQQPRGNLSLHPCARFTRIVPLLILIFSGGCTFLVFV